MKIICLILARSGSIRLPNKNNKKLFNKSLIERTVFFANGCKFFDEIFISTNDFSIINKYKNRVNIPWKRPEYLSTSKSSSNDAIIHFLKWYLKIENNTKQIFFLLQPTSPFRKCSSFKKAINLLKKNNYKCSIVGVSPEIYSTKEKKPVIIKNKKFFVNGSLYLSTIENFMKYKTFFTPNIKYFVQKTKKESVDIDTIEDLKSAKKLIV